MSTTLNIAGCKRLAERIFDYLNQLLLAAMTGDYAKSKEFAKKIVYDGENLREFIPSEICPKWLSDAIEKCKEYSGLNANQNELAKRAIVFKDILFSLQNFKWEELEIISDGINLDAEFAKFTSANHLDQAIEKLINCLQIMANDPAFHLNKKTKVDIQTLINNLRTNKYASESAIRSWLVTAGELVKLFIPDIDKVEKAIELAKKTEAALNEAYVIVDNARNKISQRLISEFCVGEQIVPTLPPTKIQLFLPEPTNAVDSNENDETAK